MRAYYESCFGLVVADSAAGHCGLRSQHWLLTLVASDEAVPATDPPARRSRTAVKLAFAVDSIAAVRADAPGLGGLVDPVTTEWTFRGSTRCAGVDPEGDVVQLVEPRRDPDSPEIR